MVDVAEDSEESPRRLGPWRREMRSFLELFALTGIAVAQPTLDLLGKNPSLFIVWRSDRSRFLALVFLLVLGPPIAMWAVEVAVGAVVPRARRWLHAIFIGVIATVIGVEVIKKATSLGPVAIELLALVVGIGGAVLVFRFHLARVWLRFLAIAPVIFALLFVVASPATPTAFSSPPTGIDVAVDHPARVVMIVMDEFPLESLLDGQGHIDQQLYPNFAALAEQATWYRNDTTVAPYTEAAVPAILTGELPREPHTLAAATTFPRNLFTILGNTYELNVHESVTALCPKSLCPVTATDASVGKGFRGMVEDTFSIWRDFAQPERTAAFSFDGLAATSPVALRTGERFVRSLRPSTRPRLDFLHVLMPHFPWHYLKTGQAYLSAGEHTFGFDGEYWTSDWYGTSAHQRHLLQVQAADTFIGSVIERLKKIGAYDSSMIVVTADHGASFTGKEPFRGVSAKNYPQILWTPLFVKSPNQANGVIDDRCARSIDVLPTILGQVGVEVPWQLDGRSLSGIPKKCRTRRIFEWEQNTLKPSDSSMFVTVDSSTGFTRVLASAAAPPGEADLRLYGIGPYGALIGREAVPLTDANELDATATVDSIGRYKKITPDAPIAWWPLISGWVQIRDVGVPLAVVVNGRIAGLTQTHGDLQHGMREYSTMIPTSLLRRDDNQIELARISGDPQHPRLQTIRVEP